MEEIIEKHFNAILVRFNIEKSEWADNVAEFCTSSQSNEEEWEQMIKDEDEKLLLSLRNPHRAPKSFAEIKRILEFRIKKL